MSDPDPEASAGERKALGAIIARLDPAILAERMVDAFRGRIPGYHRLPAPVLEQQIAQVSQRNIELFFRSIVEGVGPSEEDLAPFRLSAKDRAGEGMPLEDLLAAYRMGGRLSWQAICDAAATHEREALLLAAELTMDYVDRVSSAVAQTYLDERQHLVSEEERRLRELLNALLAAEALPAAMLERCDRLGLPVGGPLRAVAQRVAGAPAREHSTIAAHLRARGVLALTEGDRVAGLAGPDVEPQSLVATGALCAVSEPTAPAGLAEAMDEVRLLVDLGNRSGNTGLVRAADFLPELLLARSPRLAEVIRERVLGPLEAYEDNRGSDLVGTLATFVASGLDRQGSASLLHVHPNTLDYRLRRVAELTRLDLRRPEDIALVALALRQRALAQASL